MLQRKTPVPLYHQIELQLRAAIEAGQYEPGARLPSESELQERFNVSRVTVRSALRRLEEDGLTTTIRGSGTFVTKQADEARKIERQTGQLLDFEQDLIRQAGVPSIKVLSIEEYQAPRRICDLLQIDPETEITRIRRVGVVASEPLWLESRWMHPHYAPELSEDELTSASVTALYQTKAGLEIDRSHLRISSDPATTEQAKLLGIEPGDPVLINEYAVYSHGRPIDATRSVFRGDRYAFAFDIDAPGASARSNNYGSISTGGMVSLNRQEVST